MHPTLQQLKRTDYFDTYLKLLETDDLTRELDHSSRTLQDLLSNRSDSEWNHRYADGKWTVKEVLFHIIETEMIFNYRAIRIGREASHQDLPGFEEDAYVRNASVDQLTGNELLAYFVATRISTKLLYKTFSKEQLNKVGLGSGKAIQVSALFYVTAGHTLHHANILKERYLS